METRFDDGIVQNFLDLQSVVNITGGNADNITTILDLRTFERFRYTVIRLDLLSCNTQAYYYVTVYDSICLQALLIISMAWFGPTLSHHFNTTLFMCTSVQIKHSCQCVSV